MSINFCWYSLAICNCKINNKVVYIEIGEDLNCKKKTK